jgi:restriction system protein
MLFGYLIDKWKKWKAAKERLRKEAEEVAARALWEMYHESRTMDDITRMSGTQFEQFLARLFSRMGYTEIRLTPANDQGGDLLCLSPGGMRVVVQAKRWKGKVGNDAVQELLGAMRHYGRPYGMVVTNSTFTQAARLLAGTGSDITLCDRRWLEEQIREFLPPEIPEFDREKFNGIVKQLGELTRVAGTECGGGRRFRRRLAPEDFTLATMLMRAGAARGRGLTPEEIIEVAQQYLSITEGHAKLAQYARTLQGKANQTAQPSSTTPRSSTEKGK